MLAVHGQHFDDPWRLSTEMGDVCFVKWDPGVIFAEYPRLAMKN